MLITPQMAQAAHNNPNWAKLEIAFFMEEEQDDEQEYQEWLEWHRQADDAELSIEEWLASLARASLWAHMPGANEEVE